MKRLVSLILIVMLVVMTGCSQSDNNTSSNSVVNSNSNSNVKTDNTVKTYKVGVIVPLSGDAAVLGEPLQKIYNKAVKDVNAKWDAEGKNKKIELVYEDGKCSPKESLTAISDLVNIQGIKLILGGGCSGETMGAAPFANENKVVMFSTSSSSPDITNAGDYIFRNIGSDDAQAIDAVNHMVKTGIKKVAILSENTDYAQGLRKKLKSGLSEVGIDIVVDESLETDDKDLKTTMLKIKSSNPDAIYINPQTYVTAERFLNAISDADIEGATLYGPEVLAVGDDEFLGKLPNGLITFKQSFDDSGSEFQALIKETDCSFGVYCAAAYDGVVLLSEMLDKCGKDTQCIKTSLYNTQNWEGKYQGKISFDSNGDIKSQFDTYRVMNGKLVLE